MLSTRRWTSTAKTPRSVAYCALEAWWSGHAEYRFWFGIFLKLAKREHIGWFESRCAAVVWKSAATDGLITGSDRWAKLWHTPLGCRKCPLSEARDLFSGRCIARRNAKGACSGLNALRLHSSSYVERPRFATRLSPDRAVICPD
ncbi:hypothetical protein CN180_33600 [Sinorhizobium medicae]|nr:hypothetical protein CN180_33600 [Sinorhizobium medicae]